jgi:23S rRNA pseudouridine1911/1915/1917 synthase
MSSPDPAAAPRRLDHWLAEHYPQFSRSRLQEWIRRDRVLVDGVPRKASFLLRGAESIVVQPLPLPPLHATPEDIPLDVLYEDAGVIAINKPAGMTVHAGAGTHEGTLVNALLHRFGQLSKAGGEERPGIVHRLDKLTSGVILVARTDEAHRALAQQFASRTTQKTYLALVEGSPSANEGVINKLITRDPRNPTRMTARLETGREAHTRWRVLQRFRGFTFLEVTIGTGRTHQIRVHLSSIHHPVAGDPLYGARAHASGRFFLHAARISFVRPGTQEQLTIEAPLPPELTAWLASLPAL